ncbi:hypothetical protein D3C83_134750 [compost metagenome]
MLTSSSAPGAGSSRSVTPLNTEKMPVLMPTPSAIVMTAAAVKAGAAASRRAA